MDVHHSDTDTEPNTTSDAFDHDGYFKHWIDQKGVAQAFIEEMLPKIASKVLPETATVANASFVDTDLKEKRGDRRLKVRTIYRALKYLDIILEHKSYVDPLVLVQLLRYLCAVYDEVITQATKSNIKLPPVELVVVYHGKRRWKAALHFGGLLLPLEFSGNRQLDFDITLLDLGAIDDKDMPKNPTLRVGVLVLKYVYRRRMPAATVKMLLEALDEVEAAFREVTMRYIVRRYRPAVARKILEMARKIAPQNADGFVTYGEELEARGEAKGKAEGKADSLLRLLTRRFGTVQTADEQRIHAAGEFQLNNWLDRIFDARSVQETLVEC